MKKNNKGFSLVELIVVVLIMGILAVALAPQVMKWVGRADESGKRNTAESVKSALQTAAADFIGEGGRFDTAKNGATFASSSWSSTGITGLDDWTTGTPASGHAFSALVAEVTGGDYKAAEKFTQIKVTITSGYSVSFEVE